MKQFIAEFFEPLSFFLSLLIVFVFGVFGVFGDPLWLWFVFWFASRVGWSIFPVVYRWAKDGR